MVVKSFLKKGTTSCKWCAQGECWSHGRKGQSKRSGKSFAKTKGGSSEGCHTCGKPGHKSPDCLQGAQEGGGFGVGVVCFTCGKLGHKSPDCHQGGKGGGGFPKYERRGEGKTPGSLRSGNDRASAGRSRAQGKFAYMTVLWAPDDGAGDPLPAVIDAMVLGESLRQSQSQHDKVRCIPMEFSTCH